MNRADFGQLVAALRQDLGWIQFQLAEIADVDEAVISQIERGVKKHFEPELLFKLANAFQLTTLERREFLIAASGLDQNQIVRQPSAAMTTDVFNARRVVEKMIEMAEQVRLPAFLCDSYSDVICANEIMLAFFRPSAEFLEGIEQIPGGYNTARFNFGKELQARGRILDNWDTYALNSMRSFRENSLRYRAKPYFKYLMKIFRNQADYPLFDRYWKMVSSVERDKEANADYFSYSNPEFGTVCYSSATTIAITSFSELYLVYYLPLDEPTRLLFEELAKATKPGVMQFASWPLKTFPQQG